MYKSENYKGLAFLLIVFMCIFFPEVVGAIIGLIASFVFVIFAVCAIYSLVCTLFFDGDCPEINGVRYTW